MSATTCETPDCEGLSRSSIRAMLERQAQGAKIKKPDPTVERDLQHGWLLPFLLRGDDLLWGRWDYWTRCQCAPGQLPSDPIPEIDFSDSHNNNGTRKMLEAALNCIPQHGSWQTWGGWQFVNYFFDWLLFGFGHSGHRDLPEEPGGCTGASNRLYQVFNLDLMQLHPCDYFGYMLAENAYGKKQGFYPTPHCICEMMTRMTFPTGEDNRTKTMMDPCVGTGRFPLHASNHTLRLYAQDIDGTLCKATLVNAYIYAPWLAKPIAWLDCELCSLEHTADSGEVAAPLSDEMTAAAPPHAQGYLFESEHDSHGQSEVAPVLKRRRKSEKTKEVAATAQNEQASLFLG